MTNTPNFDDDDTMMTNMPNFDDTMMTNTPNFDGTMMTNTPNFDGDHTVYWSFLETNFVFLWEGYLLLIFMARDAADCAAVAGTKGAQHARSILLL